MAWHSARLLCSHLSACVRACPQDIKRVVRRAARDDDADAADCTALLAAVKKADTKFAAHDSWADTLLDGDTLLRSDPEGRGELLQVEPLLSFVETELRLQRFFLQAWEWHERPLYDCRDTKGTLTAAQLLELLEEDRAFSENVRTFISGDVRSALQEAGEAAMTCQQMRQLLHDPYKKARQKQQVGAANTAAREQLGRLARK